jgi:hypothetical protein
LLDGGLDGFGGGHGVTPWAGTWSGCHCIANNVGHIALELAAVFSCCSAAVKRIFVQRTKTHHARFDRPSRDKTAPFNTCLPSRNAIGGMLGSRKGAVSPSTNL